MLTHIRHRGTRALWCGKFKLVFMSSSPSPPQHRLDSPNPETCWNLNPMPPPKIDDQYVRQSGLSSVTIEMASFKRAAVPFFRLWLLRVILLPFSFPFPESQGRLVKSC